MLKREDLEELRDLRGTEWGLVNSRGKTEVDFDAPAQAEMSALLAAAPKLALACLEALALTRRVVEHFADTDAPLGIAAQDVRSLLFNELTAAGVEVK